MKLRIRPVRIAALAALGCLLLGGAVTASALDFDEIVRLKLAGVGEATILKLVETEQAVIVLSVDQIIRLKEVGSSEDFIRELMDTPQRFGVEENAAAYETGGDANAYTYDDNFDWANDYYAYGDDDYATVFTYQYYDPFAYYWYPWPNSYVYYAPFWWTDSGFYYAGHWSSDWWDPWGPAYSYCDSHYGYGHHFGHSHTRHDGDGDWHRVRGDAPLRAEREDRILRRAGLDAPSNIRAEARVRVADLRTRETGVPTRARVIERPAYRDGSGTYTRGTQTRGTRSSDTGRTVSRARTPGAAGAASEPSRPEYRRPARTGRSADRSATSARAPRGASRSESSSTSRSESSREDNHSASGESSTPPSGSDHGNRGGSGGRTRSR
jgi:hypothetical protein